MTGVIINSRDVTERRRIEALVGAQKHALGMIAEDAPLGDVLDRVAAFLESQTDSALCSILLLDAAGNRLRHGASRSLPDAFVRAIDGVVIGQSQYNTWRANFGAAGGAGSLAGAAVPEPTAALILLTSAISGCGRRRRAATADSCDSE